MPVLMLALSVSGCLKVTKNLEVGRALFWSRSLRSFTIGGSHQKGHYSVPLFIHLHSSSSPVKFNNKADNNNNKDQDNNNNSKDQDNNVNENQDNNNNKDQD